MDGSGKIAKQIVGFRMPFFDLVIMGLMFMTMEMETYRVLQEIDEGTLRGETLGEASSCDTLRDTGTD